MDSILKVEKSLLLVFMITYKTQQINSNLCALFCFYRKIVRKELVFTQQQYFVWEDIPHHLIKCHVFKWWGIIKGLLDENAAVRNDRHKTTSIISLHN